MGILSNLFKQKSAKSAPERAEGRPRFAASVFLPKSADAAETPADEGGTPPLEEAAAAPQRNIAFGRATENPEEIIREQEAVASSAAPAAAKVPGIRSRTRSLVPVKAPGISDKQIAIDIDDVAQQIPREFLKGDRPKNAKKTLLFNTYELLPGISQGKATVAVSRIAQLAPELFTEQNFPADAQVELPLEKIVAQIGVFPGRPDQVKEVFPPLDERYANLVAEKGGLPPAPEVAREIVPEKVPAAQIAPVEDTQTEPPEPRVTAEIPAEKGMNGSAGNGAEKHPELETVSYSLAAIFPHVPPAWLDGKLKSVDHAARITVPFELVEVQLATGRVELPFTDFFHALPENLKGHFSGDRKGGESARVLIPLNEVFQNLPGVEPLPPPPAKPVAPGPEDELETPEPAIIAPAELEAEIHPAESMEAESMLLEEVKLEPEVAEIAAAPVVEDPKLAEPEFLEPAPGPVEAAIHSTPVPAATEEAPAAVVEPIAHAEPAAAKAEPVGFVEPEPVATPAVEPAQEPAKAEIAPPPMAPRIEPPQLEVPDVSVASEFITPHIQVQRLAPPPMLSPLQFVPDPSIGEEPARIFPPSAVTAEPVEHTAPMAAQAEPVGQSPQAGDHAEPVAHIHPPAHGKPAIKDLIVTDGKLDTKKTVEHVILLPGISAAALTIKGKSRISGEFPANFHPYETGKALFQSLESHGPKGVAVVPRAVTLHHENFATTHFKQGGIMLCVLHPHGPLDADAHHAVLLVVQEIVRLRQH